MGAPAVVEDEHRRGQALALIGAPAAGQAEQCRLFRGGDVLEALGVEGGGQADRILGERNDGVAGVFMRTLNRGGTMRTTLAALAALLVWAAPASAAAPGASTGAPKDITDTAATLTGTVNPKGQPTSYFFEYGTSTSYGSRTANTSAGNANKAAQVTAPVSGLKATTTYHYRLVAFSPEGTTRGGDRSFKTTKVPVTLTIDASPNPVLFGGPVTVSGVVGGRPPNTPVELQRNAFPFTTGFTDFGNPQVTNTNGQYSFPVLDVGSTTQFRVRTTQENPTAYSQVATEGVSVNVSVRARVKRENGFARVLVTGTVRPAHEATPLAVQKLKNGKWTTVKGGVTRHASAASSGYSVKMNIKRGGFYRVFVRVTDGDHTNGVSPQFKVRAKR
jgi:hypothetical protein